MSPRRPQVVWVAHGRGPALVLVNGWAACGAVWPRAWVRSLRERFRVITLDNRGSGWSRYAETPFTMEDLAGDVRDVLDAAGEARATVLGISMGGHDRPGDRAAHPRARQRPAAGRHAAARAGAPGC
jgi:pimeloyl-ACP methyl ester carboxylesterase